ncbi:hypothetical protein ABPG74_004288 [Tetrahymena malaccensis]
MGNFCGKKPQKSHFQYRDNMLPNMIPNINDDIINRLVDQWQGSVIAYFKQRFKQYANKEDNSLDQHDFIKIFPQLASFPKNVKKKAFDFFDRDRNGKVDFKEFCQSLSVCCKSDVNSKIYLLYMLFDTDNDKYLSRNEVQTMIKYCSHYIFKIRASDHVVNNSSTNKIVGNIEKESLDQQKLKQHQSQLDRLSVTQGNIAINDAYVATDNIKILSKTASKELGLAHDAAANNTQDKNQKQQQKSQKEIQKKQQILIEQQEKETLAYLFNKKQDKIGYQTFYNWAIDYFNVEEFFLMFELVPDPLLEREIIRSIIKEEGQIDSQINKVMSEYRQKQQLEEQSQVRNGNQTNIQEASKNNKKNSNGSLKQQQAKVGNSFEKLLQKERFTETIYVVSWKWWFMWRYYINYAYKIKKMNTHNQQKMFKNTHFNAQEAVLSQQDKNSTNAVNYNDLKNNSPPGIGLNLISEAANSMQEKGNLTNSNNNIANKLQINQQKGVGVIGEEQNDRQLNDFSNIANNDSLYRSQEQFDQNSNSPAFSPQQRDSNHSRNSMVDLEFNNSIPSERQEEQKVKYHLKPNAFKNNLEINARNLQENEIHFDISHQNQVRGHYQHQNQQYNSNKILGGEEDIISDHNLFRPYSPSKVNHDLNNFGQAHQNVKNMYAEKVEQIQKNENQDNKRQGDDGLQSFQGIQNNHNQPQESQVRSVSHHHQFQQQGSFFTPRQSQQQNQNYQQETSGNKQIYFSNAAADKHLLNYNSNTQRDINDSELFQNPNWNNQQYDNSQNNSPSKHKGIINPQQVQTQKIEQFEDQHQNLFNYQGGQQLLNFPDTPSSVPGLGLVLPQSIRNDNNQDGNFQDKAKHQVETHNFVAHQNETELISQNNSNVQQQQDNKQQQYNISQRQAQDKQNDNQTIYNEVLHPETRGMNTSIVQMFQQSQVYQQQQQQYQNQLEKANSVNDGLDLMQIEQSERVEIGQSPQDHVQLYIQKSVYAGQNQSERNKPTINPNIQGNMNQITNKNDQQSSQQQQSKNGDQPSTLFSQIKFNICKPLQGLKGETHDLISQDDLSKSNIAAATNKHINNNINNQVEQSQFAKEYQNNAQPELLNQTSTSPKKSDEPSSPQKQQNIIDVNLTTILTTQNNIQKSNQINLNTVHIPTDKMLHDDYMDEFDKGIQNTEEFGDHEEEEDHKKVNDDRLRFQQYSGHNLGDRPTQIDNTDIEGEFQGELQKNILKNNDYVIIPEKAWEKLFSWYSGGPTFKRKRIVDIQKNYKTVELYPPLVIGYKCRKNGEINYDSRQELMVSSWKTLKEVMKKFQKYFKSEKQEDILYYKKMGSYWNKATDLDKTMIVDLQIESGTIFLFLTKAIEEKFLEKQKLKTSIKGGINTFTEILDTYEVGDRICVFHPSERIEKKGYIFSIKNDTIQIHFKRESYRNDIIFEKKKLENYLKQESNQVSQLNIDQSITHLNNHIKYNPKMIGLANLGNTCFINCIIQFLVHTPFFRQYLLDEIYRDSIKENIIVNQSQNPQSANANQATGNLNNQAVPNVNSVYSNNNSSGIYKDQYPQNQGNTQEQQISLIHELSQLAKYLKQKPYNDIYDPVKPESLKKSIDKLMPNFSGHEQHDAQEFLQGFLDKLNDEIKIKKLVNLNKPEENSNNNTNNVSAAATNGLANQTVTKQYTKTASNGTTQPLQLKKDTFSNNKDITTLAKQTQSKYVYEENFTTQPPQFPPEPISNLPLQPAVSSQLHTDQITETNQNNKRESGDKLENQQNTKPQQVYQEFSIIKDVYMGQTINTIECSVCGNVNHKYEDFFTISLPLPIKNEILYEVTYVPRINKGILKPIKKYGIKLHRSATYGDFQQAFYKTSRINPQNVVFAEIFKNYNFKSFYLIDPNIPMRNLGIRSNDEITAFEVINTNQLLEEETKSLYPHNYTISSQNKGLKEGDFVDYNYQSNGLSQWVHGQIERIAFAEQKNEQIVQLRLLDENTKQFNHLYRFKNEQKRIMPFRTQIPFYPNQKGYVIFLVNRRKVNNTIERFGIPLCIIIPGWLTWKELHLMVFSQVKRCIDFNYLIKKYQTTTKAQTKQKIKSAKTQGYTQLGGELEEIDFNNAAQTYQNDDYRTKEKTHQEQVQYVREHRQKAPSFHGFGEDQFQGNQINQDDEYIRNRKSLINYQQTSDAYRISSKSPIKNKQQKDGEAPQLRPTVSDYQNIYKANTSTFIHQYQENLQSNGYSNQNQDGNQNSQQQNNLKNTIKQSANLEKNQKFESRNQQSQQYQSLDEYYSAFNGEIKDSIDFLQSSYFPYKLRVIDQTTQRCIICDLPLIPDVTQKEICQGCEPPLIERPIFWDIKQLAFVFAIDWKDSLSFNPSSMVPQNDESYVDLKKQKNEIKMGIPIQSCFDLFSAQEKVQLECDVCKVNQLQTTMHLLHKLPNILIVFYSYYKLYQKILFQKIHLSRFQYQNGLFEKIDDLVNFPLKKLDLSKWVFKDNKLLQTQQNSKQTQDNQNEIYDLFAVVNHLGNGHGGHYTSFVNVKEDGSELKDCWVNFDDEQVNYINQEEVLSNKGYLLIYKKKFSTSAIVNLTYKKL